MNVVFKLIIALSWLVFMARENDGSCAQPSGQPNGANVCQVSFSCTKSYAAYINVRTTRETTTQCGLWLVRKRCSKRVAVYRTSIVTRYVTAYGTKNQCCSGYQQVGDICIRLNFGWN